MKLKLLTLILIASCSTAQANTVSKHCDYSRLTVRVEDQTIKKGESASPAYSYDFTNSMIWGASEVLEVERILTNNGNQQYTKKTIYVPLYGEKTDHEQGNMSPIIINQPGKYKNTMRVRVPIRGCDLIAESITTVVG